MSDEEDTSSAPVKVRRLMRPKKQRKLAAQARKLRQTRARQIATKLAIFVGVPVLVATIYYAFVASDIYESTAVIMVQSADGGHGGGKGNLVSVSNGGSTRDSIAIKEYILSRDMLTLLEQRHHVKEHYSQPQADWWSRLGNPATFEETYERYLEQVDISFDSNSSVLTLKVKAYSAEMAQTLAQAIISLSEEKVNSLASRARADQIEFAEQEVKQAERRLTEAQRAILRLERAPKDEGTAQPATARPEPAAEPESTAPAGASVELESVLLEKAIAEKEYQAAVSSLSAAKMEAARQSRYLATIAAPSSPDSATHPKRVLGVVTVLFAALALFGIVSLLIAAVREHARV